ncbi:MAG TPA: hypothetical protein VK469_15015 [Candidatus Kapabacteria bacterium]|nr:hypothetical protein [Candidatus Kapabacteria bacterium]
MIFKSHFISMIVFSFIVSTLMAFLKYDEKKDIIKYGLKLFIYMICGVIAVSYIMRYL